MQFGQNIPGIGERGKSEPKDSNPSLDDSQHLNPYTHDAVRTPARDYQAQNSMRTDGPGATSRAVERRASPRTQIVPLGIVQLGEANGGIAFNVSEGGLAITAAMILADDYFPSLRIQFPDSSDWIETSGQIAWRSESGKEAGLRFVGLTAETEEQLRTWIIAQAPPAQIEQGANQTENFQCVEVETPDPPFPKVDATSSPSLTVEGHEQYLLFTPGALSPFRDITPVPGVLPELASPEKALEQEMLPFATPLPPVQSHFGSQARRWVIFSASAGLALLLWFSMTRTTLPFRFRTGLAALLHGTSTPSRPVKISAPPPADPSDARYSLEPTVVEALASEPSVGKQEHVPDAFTKNSPQPVSEQPLPRRPPVPNPVFKVPPTHILENARRGVPSTIVVLTPPATVKRPLDEEAPPRALGNVPVKQSPSEAIAVLMKSVPPRSDLGLPEKEIPRAKESSDPPLQPPQTPVTAPASVVIQTDFYPAIRLSPTQNQKKLRQAASLQMGHLISRVEPIYPEEARARGIEGTVTVHAIIDRDGSVATVTPVSGHPMLASVVVSAVQQWRYTQTLLAGQPVETEEDIKITFRLSR